MWELLRDRQLAGAKFRRQHQFGEYITDFFCKEAKLVVECDGAAHETPERQKIDREERRLSQVARFDGSSFRELAVFSADPEAVLDEIDAHLPSTLGEGLGVRVKQGALVR